MPLPHTIRFEQNGFRCSCGHVAFYPYTFEQEVESFASEHLGQVAKAAPPNRRQDLIHPLADGMASQSYDRVVQDMNELCCPIHGEQPLVINITGNRVTVGGCCSVLLTRVAEMFARLAAK